MYTIILFDGGSFTVLKCNALYYFFRLVYSMLEASLGYSFLIALSVFSIFIYLPLLKATLIYKLLRIFHLDHIYFTYNKEITFQILRGYLFLVVVIMS